MRDAAAGAEGRSNNTQQKKAPRQELLGCQNKRKGSQLPGTRLANKTSIMKRQSKLRPTTIQKGGDHHFYDIRKKPKNSVRFFFQNVGGMPFNQTELIRALKKMKEFHTIYIGLQETKTNSAHPKVPMMLKSNFRQNLSANLCLSSNTCRHFESHHQPGGLAVAMRNQLRSPRNTTKRDPTSMIQWTDIVTLDVPIRIFNAYRPPKTPGPSSTHTQAATTIREQKLGKRGGTVDDYFYEKLTKEVERARKMKMEVIIGGDFNEEQSQKSRMSRELEGFGLINITSPPTGPTPPTFKGGKKTLDHIWVSGRLSSLTTGYGYLPYGLGFSSDHRGCFVDLRLSQVREETVLSRRRRKLSSKNVKLVKLYLDRLRQLVQDHGLKHKLDTLEQCKEWGEHEENQLQEIDAMWTTFSLTAEASLQKPKSEDTFSEILHRLKQEKHYWRRILNLTSRDDHFALEELCAGHEKRNLNYTFKEIRQELRRLGILIKETKLKECEHREKMLEMLVGRSEEHYDIGGITVKASLKSLRNAETSKKKFAQLRRHKHPASPSTATIQIPSGVQDIDEMWLKLKERREDPTTVRWEKVNNKEESSRYMLEWCLRHFGQSMSTPLATDAWFNRLDPRSRDNILQDILNGDYEPPEGSPSEVIEFIKASRRMNDVNENLDILNFEHFQRFCQKQEEKKNSSPSRRHYGHLKALVWDEELLRMQFRIINLAYKKEVILKRWEVTWEALLPKDKNTAYIHRFRNITLIEGDLQYLMKAMWSQSLMREVTPHLNNQQNALKGKVVQSSILSHRIAMDIMFLNAESCMIIENDAVNCYDRILLGVAALAMKRAGVPARMIRFFLNLLQKARHHVMMGGTPSRDFYSHSSLTPIMGSGQGTGWSPPIWFLIADIILSALDENQPGLLLKSPTGEIQDRRSGEMNTDDSRQGINEGGTKHFNETHGTRLTLLQAANKANQAFERYLSLTGGKLSLEKTIYYSLHPEQKGRVRRYLPKQSRTEIKVTENFGETEHALKQYSPHAPHKMLGVYTDPACMNRSQVKYMRDQAASWNSRMLGSSLPSELKLLSFKSELVPRLKFPLPTSPLTKEDLDGIIKPALPSIKHSLGLARTTATEIIFFPKQYGGLGTVDLHLEMLAQQSQYFIQHVRNNDSAGKRMRILLSVYQMESGLDGPLEGNTLRKAETYLTDSLALTLQKELHKMGLKLQIPHWVPKGGQDTIMGTLLCQSVRKEDLEVVNRCRIWLRVHHLWDISMVDGRTIHPGYKKGIRVRESNWTWPEWEPPRRWWATWTAVVETFLMKEFPLHKGKGSEHQKHEALIDEARTQVTFGGRKWRVHPSTRYPRLEVIDNGKEEERNDRTQICDVWGEKGQYRLLASKKLEPTDTLRDTPVSMIQKLEERDPAFREVFYLLPQTPEEQEEICRIAKRGELVLGSDGSADHTERATCSLVIASRDLTYVHRTAHRVTGLPLDSGRAELYGLLSLLIYVSEILETFQVDLEKPIPYYCDNMEAINFSRNTYLGGTPKWADERNIDLKRRLKALLEESGDYYLIEHVKSHQDEGKELEDLTLPQQINRICDEECGLLLNEMRASGEKSRRTGVLQTNTAMLMVEDKVVTGSIKEELERKKYFPLICQHLGMEEDAFNRTDWKAHADAVRKTGTTSLRKLLWSQHPTRTRMKIRKQHYSNLCPLCEEVDVGDHFLTCRTVSKSPLYLKIRDEKRHKMKKIGAPDHLINHTSGLMTGIERSPHRYPIPARMAYEQQRDSGWKNFIRGRIVHEWGSVLKPKEGERKTNFIKRCELSKVLIEWLHEKWLLRCSLAVEPEATEEYERTFQEAERLWCRKHEIGLLEKDRYLLREGNKPKRKQKLDIIKCWNDAVRTAEKECKEYIPKGQTRITGWLERPSATGPTTATPT